MEKFDLNQASKARLDRVAALTQIPSPTGYTRDIIQHITKDFDNTGVDYQVTPKGGVLVTLPGGDQDHHRFITAHVDTLGGIVRAIKPDGRLKMDMIGGYNYATIDGNYVTIHASRRDETYTGTVLMHQTSVHVYDDARTAERNQENMEIRLDYLVESAEDVAELGINIGDFISFNPRTEITDQGFIKSRHLDDKVSVALLLEAIQAVTDGDLKLANTTHFYISNNEEIGYGGNSNIADQVTEYVAVDMGAMGDDQQTDEYSVSICVKDASGPYNLALRNHLVDLSEANAIDYKLDIYPHYGSDASAAMKAGADVKHALFGAGIDASHAYERTHAKSIDATYALIRHYLESQMIH